MDRRASDRKLCVSLSSAPEVTARRHTDHATICRFADCIFFRAALPREENAWRRVCFSHGRPSPVDDWRQFPWPGKCLSPPLPPSTEGEKKFTKETIKECFSNDLELFVGDNNVFPRFFIARFISFFIYRDKREYSLKFSDSTNSRKIREICLFGRPPIDISKSRRVPLRHASFNRIHILIRRHCERGQMLVTIRHCIRSFRLS